MATSILQLPHIGMAEVELRQILYSASAIASTFHNGDSVCMLNLSEEWVMEVVVHNARLYTLNNRLLYAHKQALPSSSKVRVRMVPQPINWGSLFSPCRGGAAVIVQKFEWSEQAEMVTLQEVQLCTLKPTELTVIASCLEPAESESGQEAEPGHEAEQLASGLSPASATALAASSRRELFVDMLHALLMSDAAYACTLLPRADLGRLAFACRGAFVAVVQWSGWAHFHGQVQRNAV